MGTKTTQADASAKSAESKLRNIIKKAVAATNVHTVGKKLGLSAEATSRLAGGLPVRAGTLALAEKNLPNLSPEVAR